MLSRQGQTSRAVMFTIHSHLTLRLRISVALPPLPNLPSQLAMEKYYFI